MVLANHRHGLKHAARPHEFNQSLITRIQAYSNAFLAEGTSAEITDK